MKQNKILIWLKIILLLGFGLFSFVDGQTMSGSENRFLLVQENEQRIVQDSLHFEPFLKIDRLEIFKLLEQTTKETVVKAFTCKDIPLPQPMDSLLELTFHTSRKLKAAALQLQLNDTCRVTILSKPEFKVFALPVKELNLILSNKIIQDEIYIDFDLSSITQSSDFDFRHLLLFEFLFQQFLQERITRGRAFSKSVFAELMDDSRPVYAPEIHFYLDGKAAGALIKKWENIKRAFKNQLYSDGFQKRVEQFNKKVHLIGSSEYNRLIVFSKMFLRYGDHFPIEYARFEISKENIELLKQTINALTDHLIVYWFKPGALDQKIMESLKNEIGEQNLLIFKE